MQRRSLLKLGIASAVVLAVAGGTIALVQPGLVNGRMSDSARSTFGAIAKALLDGTLPTEPGAAQTAINGLLDRIDDLIVGLPPHTQAELGQLLTILPTAAGRLGMVGLGTAWDKASVLDIQAALQTMRTSGLAVRQQTYAALHDIVSGSYFAGPETWSLLAYPGPMAI
jgi:hypothetical protein